MNTTAHRYFGDLTFYKKVSQLAFPLALQQLLGSAMEMVDSLMVSWIGQVSAVGCASQIHILANTIIWGMLSGTNIFTAQFYGAKDDHNLKRTFAYSLVICLGNALFWVFLASFFGREILSFYMQDETVVQQALNYLSISRFSLIPAAIAFTFSYTYRTVHEVSLTVKVSIFSMFLNICLNSLLIFGLAIFNFDICSTIVIFCSRSSISNFLSSGFRLSGSNIFLVFSQISFIASRVSFSMFFELLWYKSSIFNIVKCSNTFLKSPYLGCRKNVFGVIKQITPCLWQIKKLKSKKYL